jgi:hypothetical protein
VATGVHGAVRVMVYEGNAQELAVGVVKLRVENQLVPYLIYVPCNRRYLLKIEPFHVRKLEYMLELLCGVYKTM